MPTIQGQRPQIVVLEAGQTLVVTTDALSSGLIRRIGRSGGNLGGYQVTNVPISSSRIFGPYPTLRHFSLEVAAGLFTYVISFHDYGYAVELGNVEAFTGNRRVMSGDNGKVFRCEDASAVTITVSNDLPEGFNVGFVTYGAGSLTISADTGATNRSSTSALSAQYKFGSLIVTKNATGSAAEFLLGGDFA